MENTGEHSDRLLPLSKVVRIDEICDRFDQAIKEAIKSGAPWPGIEDFLGDTIEPVRSELRKELMAVEASYREQQATSGNAANADVRLAESGDAPTAEQTVAYVPNEQPGTIIAGRYKLLEAIGEGGMGTVWVAEQTQPVRRKVALKLIKAGMDSKSVLARFGAERQALAVMDHPNIAKVLDGGLTATGRPFFVMEYVKGVPITDYCEATRLSIPERLQLFVQVCQAVQHAHQKGIIHRDLKPSNILVAPYDDHPVPKVIDFGLAKAMHQPLTERTLFTAHESVLGTPLYMSPEQAQLNNIDVDTRSDLYSLGVLLYELLTGTTPLEKRRLKQAAWDEVRRIIREEEPPRPSMRLSSSDVLPSLAAGRQIEPARLTRLVRGELDWIVMKALEKDRTRRYETANGFAMDIQRYLAGEPVLAAPPSARYRLRKFARKHRTALTTAAVISLLLVAGAAFSAWQAVRATQAETAARAAEANALQEKKKAEEEKQIAQSVRDFLQNKLLGQADSRIQADALLRSGGLSAEAKENPTIRELLDRAARELAPERIDANFPNQPLIQAEILQTVGNTYRGVGEYKRAIGFLQRSTAQYRQHLGPNHPETLTSMNNLAVAYQAAGRQDLALPLFEETLTLRKEVLGPYHPNTLASMCSLAWAYQAAGKPKLAVPLFEETLQHMRSHLGRDHPDMLTCMNNLALAYFAVGKQDRALSLFEETLMLRKEYLPPDHPDTLVSMNNLALAYQAAAKQDLAVPLFEQAMNLMREKDGPYHPDTLTSMNNLALAYQVAGNPDGALRLFKETLKLRKEHLPPDHPDTLASMLNLAEAYRLAGRPELAVLLGKETVTLMNAKLPAKDPSTLTSMNNLALAYQATGKRDMALRLFDETLNLRKVRLGLDHPDTLVSMANLADAYRVAGKLDLALPLFGETLKLMKTKFPPEHPSRLASMNNLALAYQVAGKPDLALALFVETLKVRNEHLGPDHPDTLVSMANLADAYRVAGKLDLALPLFQETVKLMNAKFPPEHPSRLAGMNNLALAYQAAGKPDLALALFVETLKVRNEYLGPDHPDTLVSMANLAWAYQAAGKPDLALPLLEAAYLASKKYPELRGVGTSLLDSYVQTGKTEQVATLAKELLADARTQAPKESSQLAGQLALISLSLLHAKAFTAAEPLLRECLAIREKTQPDEWTTFGAKSMLGGALSGQRKYAEAAPLLLAGYEGMKQLEAKIPPPAKVRLTEAIVRLVQFYEATDKSDEATKWRKELDAWKESQERVKPDKPRPETSPGMQGK